MTSAVVLIIYKRQENLPQIIEVLRTVKPKKIYVIADGPKPGEESAVAAARGQIELIDWDCKIKKIYAKKNLGLRERFSTGIAEVFKYEERAIFLEDDCLPDPTFFRFCDELLAKYASDERVMTISGDNFQFGQNLVKASYYFSRYPHVWGWATWKRAWAHYDPDLKDWERERAKPWLRDVTHSFVSALFWRYIFGRMYTHKIDTWDYQLTYASLKNNYLNIIPAVNLVTNVGYGDGATNTRRKSRTMGQVASPMPFPLVHPRKIRVNMAADATTDRHVFLHPLGILSLVVKSILGIL
jgi:hypothetical protein